MLASSFILLTLLGGIDLHRCDAQMRDISRALHDLQERAIIKHTPMTPERLQHMLDDGIALFVEGDHERAALALMAVLDRTDVAPRLDTSRSLEMLADSLFKLHSDGLAQLNYARLIEIGSQSQRARALAQMIAIADRQGDWTATDEALRSFKDPNALPPEVWLAQGKSALMRGDVPTAQAVLQPLESHPELGMKARYMQGVALLQEGNVSAALTRWNELAASPAQPQEQNSTALRAMAQLNVARMLLDAGDADAAREAYGRALVTPDVREDALYERAWAGIKLAGGQQGAARADAYQGAGDDLDLFLISPSHVELVGEARLLQGTILLEDRAFAAAGEAFDRLAVSYDQPLLIRPGPPQLKTLERDMGPWAGAAMQKQPTLRTVLRIYGELEQSATLLADSIELVDGLLVSVELQLATGVSNNQKSWLQRALATENALTALEHQLIDEAQRQVAAQQVTDSAGLEPIAATCAQLPREEEYSNRHAEQRDTVTSLQRQVFAAQWDVRLIDEQLDGLHIAMRHFVDPEKWSDAQAVLRLEQQRLEPLREQARELAGALRGVLLLLASDLEGPALRQRREGCSEQVERIRVTLEPYRPVGPSLLHELFMRLDGVSAQRMKLWSLRQRLSDALAADLRPQRASLVQMRRELSDQSDALTAARDAAMQPLNDAANVALANLQGEWAAVVLRSRAGELDAAWGLKLSQEDVLKEALRRAEALNKPFAD